MPWIDRKYAYNISFSVRYQESLWQQQDRWGYTMTTLRGIDNLLLDCVKLKADESVLLVQEPADNKVYSPEAGKQIASRIRELGAHASLQTYPLISEPGKFPTELSAAMEQVDHTIFLSRIGDYSRFVPFNGRSGKTQCYALDEKMLASHFAGVSHQLMSRLHKKLEAELMVAQEWHFTCELGTDLRGSFCWPSQANGEDDDFSLALFPVTTFKPVPCHTANGTVALSRWLMPGGAAKIQPSHLSFEGVVLAEVDQGMITGFQGTAGAVRLINKHYDRVANTLGINRNRVHSWHAGLNPHAFFDGCMMNELERWEGISFASPRYLHLHTCGDVPPGEITWSVFNPSVRIDGETYWENGQLVWYQREDNRALLAEVPGSEYLLETSRCIKV